MELVKISLLWVSLPHAVLKQKFDGSFIREHHPRGNWGVGGVIRDHDGTINIIRTYSGLATVVDANEAKTFSLLLGYRELKAMNGFKAIIEGDSFLAIQWGSTSITYPCRLDDWVKFSPFLP